MGNSESIQESYVKEELAKGVKTIQVEEFKRKEVSVMVAGLPRTGKSTALNNIFGLDFEAISSPFSVTQHVNIVRVMQNDVVVNVIDTPGLGALDVKKEDVLAEMKKLNISRDFTLLYCISVAPNSCLTEVDQTIIKNIQSIFGKWIWNRCILLMTSSDIVREKEFQTDNPVDIVQYLSFLRRHAEAFHELIQRCGAEVPGVMTLFDYTKQDFKNQKKTDKLVAVPVSKDKYAMRLTYYLAY